MHTSTSGAKPTSLPPIEMVTASMAVLGPLTEFNWPMMFAVVAPLHTAEVNDVGLLPGSASNRPAAFCGPASAER